MSRAFVKEAEEREPRCPSPPGCGGNGIPVTLATIAANLAPNSAPAFHSEAFYCPDPECEVAYFDAYGSRVPRTALLRRAWPKDADHPVCTCFDVSAAIVEEWAENGEKARMRELLARVNGPQARCATLAPDGRKCEENLRRVFLRALERDRS